MAQQNRFRSLVMVASAVVMGMVAAGEAAADTQKQVVRQKNGVTLTSAVAGGEAVLVAKGHGASIEKRGTTERATITLVGRGDRVTIALASGSIRLTRGTRTTELRADKVTKEGLAEVRAMLDGSSAITGAARLHEALGSGDQAPASIVSALAFVKFLSGDRQSMRRIADSVPSSGGVRFARYVGPDNCWVEYSGSVNNAWEDREECVASAPWNILVWHGCNFEWTIRAEIAWFWLLSCAGGLPAI